MLPLRRLPAPTPPHWPFLTLNTLVYFFLYFLCSFTSAKPFTYLVIHSFISYIFIKLPPFQTSACSLTAFVNWAEAILFCMLFPSALNSLPWHSVKTQWWLLFWGDQWGQIFSAQECSPVFSKVGEMAPAWLDIRITGRELQRRGDACAPPLGILL